MEDRLVGRKQGSKEGRKEGRKEGKLQGASYPRRLTEWVPPEVGLVGRGVGVGGVGVGGGGGGGCLGQNQYCGHPSLGTPCLIPNSLLALTHLRLRSKSEDEAEVADVAWRGEDGCRCRVITTLKTRVALAHPPDTATPCNSDPVTPATQFERNVASYSAAASAATVNGGSYPTHDEFSLGISLHPITVSIAFSPQLRQSTHDPRVTERRTRIEALRSVLNRSSDRSPGSSWSEARGENRLEKLEKAAEWR
ncbi:hypothetical protein V1478_000599 [Vespula squamosa]|uniref:Uncharacterized protein n=1 Tax=Vespula squamosa TaxID=30214 RepID=A0ABD2C5Y2_VESSQ